MSPENTAKSLIPERCAYRNVKGTQCLVETNDQTIMLRHLADRDHVFIPQALKPEYKPTYYHCGYRRPKKHDQTQFETCGFVTIDPDQLRTHAIMDTSTSAHSMHAMAEFEKVTGPTPSLAASAEEIEALDRIIHGIDEVQAIKFPSTRDMYLETRDKLYRLLANTRNQGPTPELILDTEHLTTRLEALILLRKTEDGPTNRRQHFSTDKDKH